MKKAGNLYEKITAINNLKIAYYKAKKGKRLKKDVLLFRINMEERINKLQSELLEKDVKIGNYHFFNIYDPKERIICAADFRERILHHAVMNIMDPVFERFQIYDSYACRKNKGTHRALKRAYYFTKKYGYFIKLDIKKYFDSIHHRTLKNLLKEKIKDGDVLELLEKIIDSYEKSPGRGIPIGNLTSQYFANYYLGFVDRFIKETLRVKGYVRYMDDMVIWLNDKNKLKVYHNHITEYISSKLCLNVKTGYINRCSNGIPFLGFLVKPSGIFLMRKSRERFTRRYKGYLRKYDNGIWDQEKLAEHTQSIIAWTLIANARGFRYNVFSRYYPGVRSV